MVSPKRQKRIDAFRRIDLYPVTCERLSAGRSDLEVLDGLIAGGAKVVQLREKDASAGDLYRLAARFRKRTAEDGVLLIINDHVDIAMAVNADGVHLGQDDMPPEAVRSIAPDLMIGVSTHTLEQAFAAEAAGVDYINIGPIFPTDTKETPVKPLGPEAVSGIGSRVNVPFTVMGGIKESNMEEVLDKGARRLAVVTAVTQGEDIAGTVKRIRERIINFGKQ